MDTVDHDDLAAEAAGEGAQYEPRDIAELSTEELRTRFSELLYGAGGTIHKAVGLMKIGADMAAIGELRRLQQLMYSESRAVRP